MKTFLTGLKVCAVIGIVIGIIYLLIFLMNVYPVFQTIIVIIIALGLIWYTGALWEDLNKHLN